MRRSSVRWGFGVSVVVATVSGCASLLGDFSTSGESNDGGPNVIDGSPVVDGSVPPGSDSGGDANPNNGEDSPSGDGQSQTDAGPDAASFLLSCAFSLVNPIQIESLEGAANQFYQQQPHVAAVNEQQVQILENGENGEWTMFWINPQSANKPVSGEYSQPIGDNGGGLFAFGRVAGGTALMTSRGLLGRNNFSLTIFEDSTDNPGNPPTGNAALSPTLPALNSLSATFAENAPGDFVWAAAGQGTTGDGSTTVYGGQGYPDGGFVGATLYSTSMHGGSPVVIHDGTTIHVYMSSSPDQGGTIAFGFADDGSGVDGGGISRALDPDGGLPSLLMGATESDGGVNFAFADIDLTSGIGATLRVGQVPSAKLTTFLATDIPAGLAISNGQDLPVQKGFQGWFGDQFVMVGSGQPIATTGGINFLWYDAQGHLRGNRLGANALLTGHTTIDGMGIALEQALGSLVTWHLVWSEQVAGADGGLHDVLYYDQVTCD